MNEATKITLDAVKASLNNNTVTIPESMQEPVYRISKDNGFSGMIFTALNHQSLHPGIFKAFQKDFLMYNTQDIKQLETIKHLKDLLNKHAIAHIFLKGSHLKTLYPATYMRGMGDIDILIHKEDMKAVHHYLLDNKFTLEHKSDQHDAFISPNGMMIEVHPKLYKPFDTKYEPLFDDVWSHAIKQDHYTFQFDPHFELAYLLYHIVKHFHGTGIGLRTVLDIGIFLDQKNASIDLDKLTTLLHASSLYTFFINMLYLNHTYFNITPYKDLIDPAPIDDATFNQLTEYITTSGIHGKGTSFNNFISRLSASKLQNKGKLRFTLGLMFPSYQTMKGLYPWLKYMPLLYPFTWFIRLFTKLVFQSKRMKHRVKQLRVNKDTISNTSTLYKKIGL